MVADQRNVEHMQTILAPRGNLATDDEAKTARLRMYDGTLLSDYAAPRSYDRTAFESFELNVSFGAESVETSSSYLEEPRRMSWPALLAAHSPRSQDSARSREQEIEIHRRMAVPFACALMPWLGVALGVSSSRAARSRGVVVGLVAILLYYFLVTAGMTLVHQGVIGAPAALWGPNVLLLGVSMAAFRPLVARPRARRRP
jgi:lipopolysaccharide export system permease protein